jgi:hypothetical protein
MPKRLFVAVALIVFFSLPTSLFGLDIYLRNYQHGGVTINRVANPDLIGAGEFRWAVGDCGQVFKLYEWGEVVPDYPITLNAEYNLTGVAFGNWAVGYIVGFKRNDPLKWKGTVWKTTNGGTSWDSLQTSSFPGNIPVPFLNVDAGSHDFQGVGVVWVSCGHGYVIRSEDGGASWHLSQAKPGGENHFGWLWGISSPYFNNDYAWVCSDQSGLFANKSYLK